MKGGQFSGDDLRLLHFIPILVYAALAIPLLDIPLRSDEVEWAPQAEAILRRGVPEILPTESPYVLRFHPRADLLKRYGADYGLWHPPAYLYALTIPIAVFGDGTVAVRCLGLVTGIITLLIVLAATYGIARRGGSSPRLSGTTAVIAGLLTATNPFWVHGSLVVDIDNTVLTLFTLAFLFLFTKSLNGSDILHPFPLFALLTLMLWAKPPGFVLLLVGLYASLLMQRRWRAMRQLTVVAILSGGVFVATWFLYALITGIPWDYPLVVTYVGKASAVGSRSLFAVANAVRFTIAWMGLPSAGLVVAAFVLMFLGLRHQPNTTTAGETAFLFTAMAIGGFYTAFWTLLGKYTVVLVPLLAVPIAICAVREISRLQTRPAFELIGRQTGITVLTLVIVVFAYQWFVVGDIVTAPADWHIGARNFALAIRDPRPVQYLAAGVPLFLSAVGGRFLLSMKGTSALLVACLIFVLPSNLAQNLKLMRHQETSIVTPRSESGFVEAVAWLNRHLMPSDTIMTEKDLAYYLHNRQPNSVILPAEFKEDQREAGVKYVVADSQLLAFLGFGKELSSTYSLVQQVGNFEIYRRQDEPTAR